MRGVWGLLKTVMRDFIAEGPLRLAAAFSFYVMLSLAPLLLIILAVAGALWGHEAAADQLVHEMENYMGRPGAEVVQAIIRNTSDSPRGRLALAAGIVTLLFSATGAFVELQHALNAMWNVEARPGRWLREWLRDRLVSAAMVLLVGILMLLSLVLTTWISAFSASLKPYVPQLAFAWQAANLATSYLLVAVLIALVYKFLPDVRIAWRDVWIGASVTSLLFTLGKHLIGLYLSRSGIGSPYGAMGSAILLLVWVYYSSLVVFLGAEFTQVYARHCGREIEPASYARRVPLRSADDRHTETA